MNVVYEQSDVRMNAVIRLNDIPEEVYRDIVAFISLRLEKNDDAVKAEENLYTKAVEATKQYSEKAQDEEEKDRIRTRRYMDQRREEIQKEIRGLYADWKEHPERYTIQKMTARDFLAAHPELADSTSIAIGKFLLGANFEYTTENKKYPGGTIAATKIWSIPVRRKTIGDVIKEKRTEARLSCTELANVLRIDPDGVKRWENGDYIPSENMIHALEMIFGIDMFDEVRDQIVKSTSA